MAALYLLFCADEERKSLNENYTSFAVPLGRWAERLASGGRLADGKARTPETQVSISAIQMCQNYLRAYDDSWKELGNQKFLEHLYASGVGFYVFPGCKTIDLAFSLKLSTQTTIIFSPMVISVKSRAYFSLAEAKAELEKNEEKGERIRFGTCPLFVGFLRRRLHQNRF